MNTILRFFFYLFATFIFLTTDAKAQKHLIKFDAFGAFSGNFGGTYEFVIGPRLSVGLTGHYVTRKQRSEDAGGVLIPATQETGYNIVPEVRFYINGQFDEAPNGLYIGGNYAYEKLSVTIENTDTLGTILDESVTNTAYGIIVGHQWVFNQRFVIDLSFNPYYNISQINALEGDPFLDFYEEKEGFKFDRIGISVGLAF